MAFDESGEAMPAGWVFRNPTGKICYVVGNGNHRIAIAAIQRNPIELHIVGIWNGRRKIYGFNLIVNKVKQMLRDSNL